MLPCVSQHAHAHDVQVSLVPAARAHLDEGGAGGAPEIPGERWQAALCQGAAHCDRLQSLLPMPMIYPGTSRHAIGQATFSASSFFYTLNPKNERAPKTPMHAQVDCVAEQAMCQEHQVAGYPPPWVRDLFP